MLDFLRNLYYLPPTVDYCEQPTGGLIERPFYAISNFSFIIVGFIILFSGKKSLTSKAFGYSAIAVGVFSFIYDSTYSYLFQLLDVTGMYILITLLLFLNFKRLGLNFHRIVRWLALVTGIAIFYFFKGEVGNIVFGLFVLLVIITEWLDRTKISKKDWNIGIILFLIGFLIWIFDATKTFCDPNNIFNGRGIFHLFEAAAIYYMFKHYSKLKIDLSI